EAAPLQGLAARAEVLEAALQSGWRDELEAELVQLYRDWQEADPAAAAPRVALMRLQQQALDRAQQQRIRGAALKQLAQRFPGLAETEAYRKLEQRREAPASSARPSTSQPAQAGAPLLAEAAKADRLPEPTAADGSRLPEVIKLAVSADPERSGASALTPARTLYVAFEYHHFKPAATVLQAVLFDGA